ncbi:MAG: UDP-glucose 4-epimerase GalE [Gemmatimonadetes bacterium]|nr:UDP-glucose 4-epimerase GalE [Gemmatimonadota bacterium]
MEVLVTGGAGYIGSVVAERLLEAGHHPVVLDNLSRGHRAAVPPDADFLNVDLRDRAALAAALGGRRLDAVMPLAASSLVGESMEKPGHYFENNVTAGIHLVEEAMAAGADRFVFSSTAATYGEPDRTPITEDFPTEPTNVYGESKLAFERILQWYRRLKGLRVISLRYFNAAGASAERGEDHDPETHLIPLVLDAAAEGGELAIFGGDYPTPDGTCIRDYIHILDLADAHLCAMDAVDRGEGGAFNLGNGAGFSVKEVVQVAETVTGKTLRTRVEARRPGDPPALVADSARARKVLGWAPAHASLEDILESAWRWRSMHPGGYGDSA